MRGSRESGFDFYWICIYPRKKVDHVCILVGHWRDINTKLVRFVLDLWFKSLYKPLRKPSLIDMRTIKAQISLGIRADWSVPLLFAMSRFFFFVFFFCFLFFVGFFSTEKLLKSLNGGKSNFLERLIFFVETVISGLFSPLITTDRSKAVVLALIDICGTLRLLAKMLRVPLFTDLLLCLICSQIVVEERAFAMLFVTVNPLYNDTRYNENICYNDILTGRNLRSRGDRQSEMMQKQCI